MKFKGIKIGDKVVIQEHRSKSVRTVSKVGRKYFTVDGREYRLEDGSSTSPYSYPSASTLREDELNEKYALAEKELKEFGVQIDPWTPDRRVKTLAVHICLTPLLVQARENAATRKRSEGAL